MKTSKIESITVNGCTVEVVNNGRAAQAYTSDNGLVRIVTARDGEYSGEIALPYSQLQKISWELREIQRGAK